MYMSPSIIDDSMVHVQGLTAETLLEFPRRSPAVANRLGTHAISSFSHFDFEKTTIFKDTYVVDLKTGRCALFSGASKGSNFTWMPGSDDEVVWLRSEEEGDTSIVVTKAGSEDVESYDLKRIKAPINALRLKKLDGGGIALAFTGLVGPDGQPFNEKHAKKKGTGRIYDSANIRLVGTILETFFINLTNDSRKVGRVLQGPLLLPILHTARQREWQVDCPSLPS